MGQRPGNVLRSQKNRGADYTADQQQHRIEQPESAYQGRFMICGTRVRWGVCGRQKVDRFHYPIPSSPDDSRAVPQRRQMTDEQSPQVSGSLTSSAQFGQYNGPGPGPGVGFWGWLAIRNRTVAQNSCSTARRNPLRICAPGPTPCRSDGTLACVALY